MRREKARGSLRREGGIRTAFARRSLEATPEQQQWNELKSFSRNQMGSQKPKWSVSKAPSHSPSITLRPGLRSKQFHQQRSRHFNSPATLLFPTPPFPLETTTTFLHPGIRLFVGNPLCILGIVGGASLRGRPCDQTAVSTAPLWKSGKRTKGLSCPPWRATVVERDREEEGAEKRQVQGTAAAAVLHALEELAIALICRRNIVLGQSEPSKEERVPSKRIAALAAEI